MARCISIGVLFTVAACSGHSLNDLGAIQASGGSGVAADPGVGGVAQLTTTGPGTGGTNANFVGGTETSAGRSSSGGAASGGNSATGGTTGLGSSATGGKIATGGITGFGGSATGGLSATGGFTGLGGSATGGLTGTGGTHSPPALDLSCNSDADCCVISNNCQSALYLVTLTQRSELSAYLGSIASTTCAACAPPPIAVSCQSGTCVGEQLDPINATPGLSVPHCGPVTALSASGGAPSAGSANTAASGSSAAPGTGQKKAFGCL